MLSPLYGYVIDNLPPLIYLFLDFVWFWGQFDSLLQVKLYGLLHSDDDNSALEVVEIHFSSTFDGLLNTIISSMIQLTIYFWVFKEIARQLCSGSARGNCPFFPTRPLPPFPYAISRLYKIYLHSNYSLALPPSPPLPSQLTPRGDLCNKTPQAYRTKWQAQSKRR